LGVCSDAFAGKPRSYRFGVVHKPAANLDPVGARLAREEALKADN
jgi:hypothetical protein